VKQGAPKKKTTHIGGREINSRYKQKFVWSSKDNKMIPNPNYHSQFHEDSMNEAAEFIQTQLQRHAKDLKGPFTLRVDPNIKVPGEDAASWRKPDFVLSRGDPASCLNKPGFLAAFDLKTTNTILTNPSEYWRSNTLGCNTIENFKAKYDAEKYGGVVLAYREKGEAALRMRGRWESDVIAKLK
jgi:hypothetical protein